MTIALDLAADDFVRQPWTYPGRPLTRSGVMHRGSLHLTGVDGLPLSANVASTDRRALVVAVGSNASPVVMHRKFDREGVSTTVPFVTGTLRGISVGHSGHVSRRGYIAAAPYVEPGASTDVVVSLLYREQLRCLDRTERNYERKELAGSMFPLLLDGGEMPESYSLYISEWKVLQAPDGGCLRLQPQDEIFTSLLSRSATLRSLAGAVPPRTAMAQLAADETLRTAFREVIAEEGLARPGGLEAPGGLSAGSPGQTESGAHPFG
jgi:hypothetical protein